MDIKAKTGVGSLKEEVKQIGNVSGKRRERCAGAEKQKSGGESQQIKRGVKGRISGSVPDVRDRSIGGKCGPKAGGNANRCFEKG